MMRKSFKNILCLMISVLLVLCAASCSKGDPDQGTIPSVKGDDDRPAAKGAKTLVVYFSQPDDVDNSTVVIGGETLGNTQYMAYVIQENTGANIFRIVPETPYPTNHSELVDLAQTEQRENARPKFKGEIENFDQYNTVFVGYPNWWGDMPMILYTFFDTYDFSGKTIIPFNTHGGSGFSGTVNTIRRLEPDAEVKNGKSISRDKIQDAEQEIIDWVKELGFEKPSASGMPNAPSVADPAASENPGHPEKTNVLIAYFSWSETTTRLARHIKEQIPAATLYRHIGTEDLLQFGLK